VARVKAAKTERHGGMKASHTATVVATVATLCAQAAPPPETEMPEVVVTATGRETPVSSLGHAITLISRRDIEQHGWVTLPQALRHVPGVHLSQSGAPGAPVSVFIRGTRSQHALVMIDGVRINDPSRATRSANLADIDLDDVERIEVVRGPQSGLYGADALGGVINIITRRGDQRPGITVEAGSYATYRAAGRIGGRTGIVEYAASASYHDSQGFSSASDRYEGNSEDDGFSTFNVSAQFGLKPTEALSIDLSARYVDSENEYDLGAGPNADSRDNVAETETLSAHGALTYAKPDGIWSQTLSADYAVFDREFLTASDPSTFDGDNWEAEWRHDVALFDAHTLSLGVLYSDESAESDTFDEVTADTTGAYLQDECAYGPFNALASVRYDRHDQFGSEFTYRVAPAVMVEKTHTRVKGSLGTGFKAPSLYQLYAPASAWGHIGNADLKPEEMFAWDVGLEQVIVPGLLSAEIVWFQNDIDNLIEFADGYENVAEAESKGVEVGAHVTPGAGLTVSATYTYTDSEDKTTGEKLIRIPEHRITLDIACAVTERLALNVSLLHIAERNDRYYDRSMFASVDTTTDDYTIANISASYDVTDNITVFGRVENVTDADYEEVYGYGTPGVSGYGGAKVRF